MEVIDISNSESIKNDYFFFVRWHKWQKFKTNIKLEFKFPPPPLGQQDPAPPDWWPKFCSNSVQNLNKSCSRGESLHPQSQSQSHPQERKKFIAPSGRGKDSEGEKTLAIAQRVGELDIKADLSKYPIEEVDFYLHALENKIKRGEKFKDPAGWLVDRLKKTVTKTKDKTIGQAMTGVLKK